MRPSVLIELTGLAVVAVAKGRNVSYWSVVLSALLAMTLSPEGKQAALRRFRFEKIPNLGILEC
jgi:hypothetical protein